MAQDIAEREARRKAEHGTFVEPSAAKDAVDLKKQQVGTTDRPYLIISHLTASYRTIPLNTTNTIQLTNDLQRITRPIQIILYIYYVHNYYLSSLTLPTPLLPRLILDTGGGGVSRTTESQCSQTEKGARTMIDLSTQYALPTHPLNIPHTYSPYAFSQ